MLPMLLYGDRLLKIMLQIPVRFRSLSPRLVVLHLFRGILPARIPKQAKAEPMEPAEKVEARRLVRAGKPVEAARLYFDRGQDAAAVRLLMKASCFKEVGEYYEKLGNPEAALALNMKVGVEGVERAAQIRIRMGQLKEAEKLFLQAANKAVNKRRYDVAARCFRQCGDIASAAKNLEMHLKKAQLKDKGPGNVSFRVDASQAAALYLKANQPESSARMYLLGGFLKKAAEVLGQAGKLVEAAQIFLKLGQHEQAVDIFEDAGRYEEAAAIQARIFLAAGDHANAADALEACGQLEQAAQLRLDLGDPKAATQLFVRAERFKEAGRVAVEAGDLRAAAVYFEKAGLLSDAGNCYFRLEKFTDAARCYEKGENLVMAGRVLIKLGKIEESIKSLSKVEPTHHSYHNALMILGCLYDRAGKKKEAIHCFQKVVPGKKVTRENVDLFYRLAVLLMEIGDLVVAAKYFEMILLFDYNFKYAARLLATIKKIEESSMLSSIAEAVSTRIRSTQQQLPVQEQTDQTGVVTPRYQVEKQLGRGGMGIVFLARDTNLDRVVAYKVLPKDISGSQEAMAAFTREAKLAAKLNHPNIVSVYDFGLYQGTPFIVMEYVEGQTLDQIMRRNAKYLMNNLKPLCHQVAKGLAHAHSMGLVHRDIKPQNIMIRKDGIIKIMDFGRAKLRTGLMQTQSRVIHGTQLFMAPEQIMGKSVDQRTDIYSLGVLLYSAATGGRLPFEEGQVLEQHLSMDPPSPRRFNPLISPDLEKLLLSCLSRSPDSRPRDVAVLFNSLNAIDPLFIKSSD